jgi:hypothetical protein
MYTYTSFMYTLGPSKADRWRPRDWMPNCHIVAGVKSPLNAILEQTKTKRR